MKRSLIWILTIVMAITFGALLYFQIIYLENMVKMREGQFSEVVMRSLNATASGLERQEAMYYLQKDAILLENTFDEDSTFPIVNDTASPLLDFNKGEVETPVLSQPFPPATQSVGDRFSRLQKTLRKQYLYQRDLLNEIIMEIIHDSSERSVYQRADSVAIRHILETEFSNNGLHVPFSFAITDMKDNIIYSCGGFSPDEQPSNDYSIILFPNTDARYKLVVEFPTKRNYIFSSVRFIIPTLTLSVILLVIFLFTILLVFRQKRLSEMKTDFINNMTHELKTPVSTISLAAQMLGDDSVRKSPQTLSHLSEVIIDESKRLRFQIDKVLQMSILDKSSAALKFTEIDIDDVILNVVNTFKIKAEKFGGQLTCSLDASNTIVQADEMQFTNVIFSLLDNAIKYRRENVPPKLNITTRDVSKNMVEICISDNGIGISKEYQKKIFDKFFRVPTGNVHDVKGFGLGLAYVKKMVTIFGGSISVESFSGEGSSFIIRLPALRVVEENDTDKTETAD